MVQRAQKAGSGTAAAGDTAEGHPTCCRPRKGRPPVMEAGERRERILDALDGHFREVGLAGMTMGAIARRAGMSKQTLYGLFQDRDSLFEAYVERRFAQLQTNATEVEEAARLEDRLRALFRFDQPAEAWDLPIALFRLAVAEAQSHPRLARRCMEEGPRHKQRLLQCEIERACARGELSVADPAAAAGLLMDMLHLPITEALADPAYRPTTAAWKERFELGLAVFLRGMT